MPPGHLGAARAGPVLRLAGAGESCCARTPAAQLGDRYPGTLVGTIGAAALPSPNSLVIIIGRSVAELSHRSGSRGSRRPDQHHRRRAAATEPTARSVSARTTTASLSILSVVAAALLFPVLIFIGGATRLSAARREQRFAAMRLVGATPRQISVIAAVESVAAAVSAWPSASACSSLLRPVGGDDPVHRRAVLRQRPVAEPGRRAGRELGIPVAAAVAARLALRRVTISPLGVTRRVTPRPPRAWRVLPLLAGIAELGYFAYVHDIGATHPHQQHDRGGRIPVGVLLIMAGLVIAGPWLTMLASRLTARRASRPATLIAARRLADNPQAGFRAISGLVLAVFVGTCAVGIITAIIASGGQLRPPADRRPRPWWKLQHGPPGSNRTLNSIPAATTSRSPPSAASPGGLLENPNPMCRYPQAPPAPSGTAAGGTASGQYDPAIKSSCHAVSSRPSPRSGIAGPAPPLPRSSPTTAAGSSDERRWPTPPGPPSTYCRRIRSPAGRHAAVATTTSAAVEQARACSLAITRARWPRRRWVRSGRRHTHSDEIPPIRQRRHPDQPAHRRLQPGRQHRRRAGRAQAAVQPAAAGRRAACDAAAGDHPRGRRPAARLRRRVHRYRIPHRATVPSRPAPRNPASAGTAYYLVVCRRPGSPRSPSSRRPCRCSSASPDLKSRATTDRPNG